MRARTPSLISVLVPGRLRVGDDDTFGLGGILGSIVGVMVVLLVLLMVGGSGAQRGTATRGSAV